LKNKKLVENGQAREAGVDLGRAYPKSRPPLPFAACCPACKAGKADPRKKFCDFSKKGLAIRRKSAILSLSPGEPVTG